MPSCGLCGASSTTTSGEVHHVPGCTLEQITRMGQELRPSRREELTPNKGGWVTYRFQIRRDVWISLELPADLDAADVARLTRWLQTLPPEG